MSFNALPIEARTDNQQTQSAIELMEWLRNSGYTDKVSRRDQPFTLRIVDRHPVPAGAKRYSAIKGL